MKALQRNSTLSFALACFLSTSLAQAAPPKPNVFDGGNRWKITYYNDPATNHSQWATQVVCFLPYAVVGTSIQGAWYSLTFPDWNGRYYQEGDEVKMTGDYAKDVGHDHMTLIHTTVDWRGNPRGMAFKDWTEWREDGAYGRIIGWGNARLVRDGRCPISGHVLDANILSAGELKRFEVEADQFSKSLPDRLTTSGEIAKFPGQSRLESVDAYLKRAGLVDIAK